MTSASENLATVATATDTAEPGFAPRGAARCCGPGWRGCAGGCGSRWPWSSRLDAAVVLAATAAVLVFLDWWLRLGLPARLVLLAIAAWRRSSPSSLVRAVRRWRSSRLDDLSLAMTLDRFRPGTGQQVADVLQLPDLLDEPTVAVSPAMVRLAVRQASEALAASDWRSLWNWGRTAVHAGALLLALLVPTAFAGRAPDAARLSLARWLLGSTERWPQRTYLTVTGLERRGRLLAPATSRSRWRSGPTCR